MVKGVGCVGMCHQTPLVEILPPKGPGQLYAKVSVEEAPGLVLRHFKPRGFLRRLGRSVARFLDHFLTAEKEEERLARHALDFRDPPVCAFLGPQKHIATENCGQLDPWTLMNTSATMASRLCAAVSKPSSGKNYRGHSGKRLARPGRRGIPTGLKWAKVQAAPGEDRYVICNGDEGDPGAFMDRMILESFPYRSLREWPSPRARSGPMRVFFTSVPSIPWP